MNRIAAPAVALSIALSLVFNPVAFAASGTNRNFARQNDVDDSPVEEVAPQSGHPRPFKNIAKIASGIGLYEFQSVVGSRTLKVAIIDNGYRGYEPEIGVSLPRATFRHKPVIPFAQPELEETHGLAMAQIIVGLISEVSPKLDYELHLYTGSPYSNFEAAIKAVAAGQYDVVLYSQIWEYGGNGDGRGFINALVNKAAQSGTTWINAAGNYGNASFRSPVKRGPDDWAVLPDDNSSVAIRCEKNNRDRCRIELFLTWNSFANKPETGTDKDLDLVLTDDAGKIVQVSGLKQMKTTNESTQGESLYPREIIKVEVPPGKYLARVKIRSTNFSARDELRLALHSDFAKIENPSLGESIFSPADNENVITVGASDTPTSSSSKILGKPELVTASMLINDKGQKTFGSSISAAIAAAATVMLKAVQPELTRAKVTQYLSGGRGQSRNASSSGPTLEDLGFGPTAQGCFKLTNLPYFPQALRALSQATSLYVVATTAGPKVFVNDDPFSLAESLGARVDRTDEDDLLMVDARGFSSVPRERSQYATPGAVEIVQMPAGQSICSATGRTSSSSPVGAILRMPRLSDVR